MFEFLDFGLSALFARLVVQLFRLAARVLRSLASILAEVLTIMFSWMFKLVRGVVGAISALIRAVYSSVILPVLTALLNGLRLIWQNPVLAVFLRSRGMPTANAEDPCRSERT